MATPRCPLFGRCGGCTAQHIDYALQVENKRKVVADASGIADVKAFYGEPYGYRNRMDFIFHPGGLGFREKGRWDRIIDVQSCPISNDGINRLLGEVREAMQGIEPFDLRKQKGTFKYAVIRTPSSCSSISFVLNEDSGRVEEAVSRIRGFALRSSATNVAVTLAGSKTDISTSEQFFMVKGGEMLEEAYLGRMFQYSLQGFFQNNHGMAEEMHRHVDSLLRENGGGTLLDLYGGVGTFGIISSGNFRETVIVESFPGSVKAATENILRNGAKGTRALVLDARQIGRLSLSSPLSVVTDPPRSGMDPKAIDALKGFSPDHIIYVSCNPQQMKKDLRRLQGHEVIGTAMFDLFPMTIHLEGVVVLRKIK